MTNSVKCTFKVESWEETSFSEQDEGPKLAQVSVSQSYSGKLEGTGTLKYLLITFDETFSRFIGTERVVVELDDRSGSFVLDHEGTHENGVAKSSFRIVPDSGTEELSGIHGEGSFKATHEKATLMLEYDLK